MKEKKKKLKQEPVKNITVCCLKRFLSRLTIGSGSETGKVGREEKHAAFAKRMTGVYEMAEGAMQGVVGRIGGEIAVVTSVHEEKTGPFRFLDGEQINFSHQTGQIGVGQFGDPVRIENPGFTAESGELPVKAGSEKGDGLPQ